MARNKLIWSRHSKCAIFFDWFSFRFNFLVQNTNKMRGIYQTYMYEGKRKRNSQLKISVEMVGKDSVWKKCMRWIVNNIGRRQIVLYLNVCKKSYKMYTFVIMRQNRRVQKYYIGVKVRMWSFNANLHDETRKVVVI